MNSIKDKLNEELTAVLYKYFPQTKELANFLIDTLDLSKESAYRRIRNEVCYSFEEIAVLASKLDFSIDKLVGINTSKIYLNLPLYKADKPEDIYREILQSNIQASRKLCDVKHALQYTVLNRLPYGLTIESDIISKFHYYKWLFHTNKGKVKTPFCDFETPKSLIDCFKEYGQVSQNTAGKINLILDENIFLYMVREIKYFHKTDLIKDEDLKIFKEELLQVVDTLSGVVRSGTNKRQAEIKVYLSDVDIEPNYSYAEFDDNIAFYIWSPAGDIVSSTNPEFCARQKEWIESLIRYTTLITQCNEIKQHSFFDNQRKCIEEMI